MRRDKNERVKSTFVSSHTLPTCSHLSSSKNASKLYRSQRSPIPRIVIEATLINTLIQFSSIIYLAPRKIVNFFNSFEGHTFAAGLYAIPINQIKLHFLSPSTVYVFITRIYFFW